MNGNGSAGASDNQGEKNKTAVGSHSKEAKKNGTASASTSSPGKNADAMDSNNKGEGAGAASVERKNNTEIPLAPNGNGSSNANGNDNGNEAQPPSEERTSLEIQPGHGGLIKTPGSNDVLNGRGGRINSHRGNVQFRQLVNRYKHTYLASKKLDKVKIANKIVQFVRGMNPPGRFLMEDPSSGDWVEIGDDKARKKAGQAMREKSDETRKEMKQRRASGAFLAQHHPPTANTQNLSTLASVALFDFASTHNPNAIRRPDP